MGMNRVGYVMVVWSYSVMVVFGAHERGVCVRLTTSLWEVLVELLPVVLMEDIVHAGVNELFLLVLQVLGDVVGHKHDAALSVHHEQEAVQSLGAAGWEEQPGSHKKNGSVQKSNDAV